MIKRIYIAGPDVFKPNAVAIGEAYCKLCEAYGFEGLYPLDNQVDFTKSKHAIAWDIFVANRRMINLCDIIIANLNPFRGMEPDSGTVWECGYGCGQGKEVYGYMNNTQPYINNFDQSKLVFKDGIYRDKDELMVENFDGPLNLMITCSLNKIVKGGFEDVLRMIKIGKRKNEKVQNY